MKFNFNNYKCFYPRVQLGQGHMVIQFNFFNKLELGSTKLSEFFFFFLRSLLDCYLNNLIQIKSHSIHLLSYYMSDLVLCYPLSVSLCIKYKLVANPCNVRENFA